MYILAVFAETTLQVPYQLHQATATHLNLDCFHILSSITQSYCGLLWLDGMIQYHFRSHYNGHQAYMTSYIFHVMCENKSVIKWTWFVITFTWCSF